MEKRGRRFVVTLILALLVSPAAAPPLRAADAAEGTPADVLLIIHPLQKAGEAFRQVVTDAARYALEARGLVVTLQEPGSTPSGDAAEQARHLRAAAALDFVYSVNKREMAVTVSWFDAVTGTRAARAEGRGAVDLQLDAVILNAMGSVLDGVGGRVRQLKAARDEAAAARAAAEKAAADKAASDMAAADMAAAVAEAGAEQTGEKPATQEISGTGAPAGKPPSTQLLLSGSFAPFIATGAASYYFTLGYLPSILASLVFTTPTGRFGVGISAGVDYFSAAGSSDTSDNFLLPFGADVRYELAGPRVVLSIHLAGGPAVLLILTGSRQFFINVMPFIRSGIGAEILLTSWLGISVNADYEVYFEMPYLLMGFAPSLGMTFRL